MRWENPGHEYDSKYQKYKELIEKRSRSICVFGAGKIGTCCLKLLNAEGIKPILIVDNDSAKWGKTKEGICIISFEEYMDNYKDSLLILSVSSRIIPQIIKQLSEYGFREYEDYLRYQDFAIECMPLLHLYQEDYLHLDVVELCVTERCTLRCKKCAHGCANVPNDYPDLGIDVVKESADSYFEIVDYVNEFYLIGGETFLYKDLKEAIEYIGDNYRNKIDKFIITTNGTIIPTEPVLKTIKNNNMTIFISNYSLQIPKLKKQYEKLCGILSKWDIKYYLSEVEREWFDYGFDYVDHSYNQDIVEEIYSTCFTPCREIRGSRFYFCIQARCVAENNHFNVDENDFLDMSKIAIENKKKIMYEYSRGYCNKGYIDMCNYCNGTKSLEIKIPAAEQLK